ncbi:MAG: cupin domain-containing protein [Verrucomicrobiota bacterium]
MSSHKISLRNIKPQNECPCGSRLAITKENFPMLHGMALYQLKLEAGCYREPHWHPNADELGYCLSGKALVTIFSHGNQHDCFTIEPGEMFFVPSGSIHAIENIGEGCAEFILSFSHERPEDFGLSGAVGCMSLDVMGNTFEKKSSHLGLLTRSEDDCFFGKSEGVLSLPDTASFPNRLKFSIENISPGINADYGFAKLARHETWPALRSQAMYSLTVHGTGMREPHWHPETAELGYVLAGKARMTVKSPNQVAETYSLEPGDAYFIPRAYPHHIENLTNEELRFLIFFDTPHVQDIGYTGAIPAFPNRIIAPTLKIDPTLIPQIPTDRLIVKKINHELSRHD